MSYILVKITENDLNCFKHNTFVLNFYLKIFVNETKL